MDLSRLSELLDLLESTGATPEELDRVFQEEMRRIGRVLDPGTESPTVNGTTARTGLNNQKEDVA